MTVDLNVCVCMLPLPNNNNNNNNTHTHPRTHARARAHTQNPPIHLKNIIGVHTLVHINHINYVLHHVENTSLYTDNIYETDTRSIISTWLLPTVIQHTQ